MTYNKIQEMIQSSQGDDGYTMRNKRALLSRVTKSYKLDGHNQGHLMSHGQENFRTKALICWNMMCITTKLSWRKNILLELMVNEL